jgi:putative NADH-flavin reductase
MAGVTRVAILGATGATGRHVVEGALQQGFELAALAREPSRLGSAAQRMRVVKGEVRDLADVRELLRGTEAVVSVLGQTRPPTAGLLEAGARNIVDAMHSESVSRLVYLTGAGVWDERDTRTFVRSLIRGVMLRVAREVLEDSEAAVRAIKDSTLAWTVVRVPRLTDAAPKGRFRVRLDKPAGVRIARADVATFLLHELRENKYVRQLPFVTS